MAPDTTTRLALPPRPSLAAIMVLAAAVACADRAGAEPPPGPPRHLVDLGMLLAAPAALETGMSMGVEASYTHRWRWPWLAWGARASWSSATEYTLDWQVRHDDVRFRAFGVLQRGIGRATVGLRLGLGATLVHEGRTRQEGSRVGLVGEALETSGTDLLPGADLERLVLLRVWGPWGVTLSGGPSLHIQDRSARVGWLGGVGVAWQR